MQSDAGCRIRPAIGRREAMSGRSLSEDAARRMWTRLSPLPLLYTSLPVWALDGRCGGSSSFLSTLSLVLPISAISGLVAATVMALLGFLLQSSAQKVLRREFSHRNCVRIPAFTIGVGAFVAVFLGGYALLNACF